MSDDDAAQKALSRCPWVPAHDELYCAYHDTEWGVPEFDSRALFEKLVLDGMQAGLSWRVVLGKRDGIRAAFAGFDPEVLARWTEADIAPVLENPGVIRSRRKTEGAVKNARAYLTLEEQEGSFSKYLWGFVGGAPVVNAWERLEDTPTQTPVSEALAKDLKKRGFTFCGPVIVYAFMQAVGMVNDHLVTCFRHREVADAGKAKAGACG